MTMADLSLDQVVKRYGHVEVVHGIDLHIQDGEFLVLVGPSGCGKSTTLRMIAGLESLTSGTIRIGGRVVNTLEPKDRNIAMVFQNYALYPHMSVYRNIAFGLYAARLPKPEIDAKVRKAADLLGLSPLLERRPNELSGGQRQRVAMGRAIVRDPSVFLFDEPLSNLDAQLRGQMRTEIKRLHQSIGTTIVYVTHDQVEAMTLADRIVIMRDGRIEQVGTPLDVFHQPASTFVAGFIGTPTMNLLELELVRREGAAALALTSELSIALPDRAVKHLADRGQVIAGLRPDDIKIMPSSGSAATTVPNSIPGQVLVAEPLGNTTQIIVRVGERELVGMADGRYVPHAGAPVELSFDATRLHLFGLDGKRIC
jgi:multiple sugar transport system ATP-binding protein